MNFMNKDGLLFKDRSMSPLYRFLLLLRAVIVSIVIVVKSSIYLCTTIENNLGMCYT